jgi:hypothetical protein
MSIIQSYSTREISFFGLLVRTKGVDKKDNVPLFFVFMHFFPNLRIPVFIARTFNVAATVYVKRYIIVSNYVNTKCILSFCYRSWPSRWVFGAFSPVVHICGI